MKQKALRKHSLYGKISASVLLKLFISERCYSTDASSAWAALYVSNVNNIHSMIPEVQKNVTTQCWSTGRHFTTSTHALKTSCSKLKLNWWKRKPVGSNACMYVCLYIRLVALEHPNVTVWSSSAMEILNNMLRLASNRYMGCSIFLIND